MKIKPYIDKLNSSQEFHTFKDEHPDAFIIAGFFVLDFQAGRNVHQIDYFMPKENKVAAFTLDDQVKVQLMDTLMGNKEKTPQELDMNNKIDLDELKGIIQDEMKNRKMTEEIHKMIAVIQSLDGKKIWNVNCVLSGMEVLRSHIEDETKSVLKMDKRSIMDFVKTVPNPNALKKKPTKPEEIKKELKQLNKLEEEIEKEKKELKEDLEEKKSKD